ncbi:MAG: Gfo/Idh/MocA family oxidoreductase [Bacillota bacterium]|nr:Gfo/Idh/MocA family oxidoreductase [Bacillota bacterium]
MDKPKINVAIVGCGGIGGRHCEAYRQINNVFLRAFIDPDLEKAKQFREKYGGDAAFASIEELPEHYVDIVNVTTPPMLHTEPVMSALQLGADVFCEKPITMNRDEAFMIYNKSVENNKTVGVGYKMRFEPIFQKAKEMIDQIGNLIGVSIVKIQPYKKRPAFDWVPSVGAMYELSVHDYDLVTFISGRKPTRVSAQLEYDAGWTREKRAFLHVMLEGDVTGQFMSVYSEDAHFFYRDLTLTFVGTKGYMRIERPDRIVMHTDQYTIVEVNPGDGINPFISELSSFIKGIHHDSIYPCADIRDAVLTTALVEAANISHKSGRWVDLDVNL